MRGFTHRAERREGGHCTCIGRPDGFHIKEGLCRHARLMSSGFAAAAGTPSMIRASCLALVLHGRMSFMGGSGFDVRGRFDSTCFCRFLSCNSQRWALGKVGGRLPANASTPSRPSGLTAQERMDKAS